MRLLNDVIILNRILARRSVESAWFELSQNAFALKTYGDFGRTLSRNLHRDNASCLDVMHKSARQQLKKISSEDYDQLIRKPCQDLADGQRGLLELMERVWRENENF